MDVQLLKRLSDEINSIYNNNDLTAEDKYALVFSNKDNIIHALNSLTSKERCEIFSNFCRYCGDDDPYCVCCRDD